MRVHLDLQPSTVAAIGAGDGVSAAHLDRWRPQVPTLLDQLAQAAEAGLLPHLAPEPDVAGAVADGAGWRTRGRWGHDRVVVLGEPDLVAATCALVTPDAELHAIDRPDPALVAAARDGARRLRVVQLPGAPWVGTVADALAAERGAERTLVVEAGAGTGGRTVDAEVDTPGAADLRFAAVGPVALALAGWQGADGARLARSLDTVRERGARPGLRENPALRLASLVAALRDAGRTQPGLLVPSAGLQRWATWAAACLTAFSCRQAPGQGGQLRRGATPLLLTAGAESTAQRMIDGPRDSWVLALRPGPSAEPLRAAQRGLVDTHLAQLRAARVPAAVLELHDDGPADRLALSWLWLHASLVLAALDPVDPLTMDAADDLRERLSQAAAPAA